MQIPGVLRKLVRRVFKGDDARQESLLYLLSTSTAIKAVKKLHHHCCISYVLDCLDFNL